jgi:proteasome lid subunit RPN8/RPN11
MTHSKISPALPVSFDAIVLQTIRRHARTSMQAEICGVLLGSDRHDCTHVDACIAGENSSQGAAHVTFTQNTWEHIYAIKDRDYPDKKIVGWYHSHPGFGVFLSHQDIFIHENFFSAPHQVAWVFDPHSDEEGCFGWSDGKVRRLQRFEVSTTIADTVPRPEPEPTHELEPTRESDLPRPEPKAQPTARGLRLAWRSIPVRLRFLVLLAVLVGLIIVIGFQVIQLSRTESSFRLPSPKQFTERIWNTIRRQPSPPVTKPVPGQRYSSEPQSQPVIVRASHEASATDDRRERVTALMTHSTAESNGPLNSLDADAEIRPTP